MTTTIDTTPTNTTTQPTPPATAPKRPRAWQQALPWLVTLACFAYLYTRLAGAAAREHTDLASYLGAIFTRVSWSRWLGLMIPYSTFFFLIDSLVVWRVVTWFNAPLRYVDILPIRGSSYILSILNEQVGKGAMGLYLNRRYGVPAWEVGSSMIFIMFCEFFYLLAWATVGYALRGHDLPPVFGVIPWIAAGAAVFLAAWIFFFRGPLGATFGRRKSAPHRPSDAGIDRHSALEPPPRIDLRPPFEPLLVADTVADPIEQPALRDRPLFKGFRASGLHRYLTIIALRSPALLAAVFVYTNALALFGVEASYAQMLGYLPIIFFGAATPGPMRSVAITLWVILFPGNEGEMTTFGIVQHNFFIFFNAAIGLLFLRRANRELFAGAAR